MNQKKKKRKWKPKSSTFKYRVQVETSVEMVRKLDVASGHTAWHFCFDLECLDMRSIGNLPSGNYQEIILMIIYDVKQDLQ